MSQYLDFFKVNKLPENLKPNAMYLLKGDDDPSDLILHIADKFGKSTRSILSRQDVVKINIENNKYIYKEINEEINNKIINFDFSRVINFEQNVTNIIDKTTFNVSNISDFDIKVENKIRNTEINVNKIKDIDIYFNQFINGFINSFEDTSKLEVKDTYQELKQLAEDKKLNKNQFVFVVDATSPEAKVDKGSATFLYQVPDQKNKEKIKQALADLEIFLAKNGELEKEFKSLEQDKYAEYLDLLKEKDAMRQYFFKLENGQEVYQPQVNLAENRLFDLDSAMKLMKIFLTSWQAFMKDTIGNNIPSEKGTASRINKLVNKLLENYSVLRDESAHRLIKVAEHESMDLKFEVKWGDIQEIPEPITKIITGQVLLQAVEW